MQKSGKKGRPAIIHYMSDVRWTQRGVGPIVVSAGPGSVHHPVVRFKGSAASRDSRCSTQLCRPVFKLICGGPHLVSFPNGLGTRLGPTPHCPPDLMAGLPHFRSSSAFLRCQRQTEQKTCSGRPGHEASSTFIRLRPYTVRFIKQCPTPKSNKHSSHRSSSGCNGYLTAQVN